MRSLRIRYSSSSNSRWVSSIARSPRATSWVSGLSDRSATTSEARAARRAAAQQRAQAGQQLLALERLDEVVVGAGVEALDAASSASRAVSIRIGTSSARAQAPGDLDAVELRQPEVEHDEVGEERARPRRAPPRRRRRCARRSPPGAASAAGPAAISSSSSTTSTRGCAVEPFMRHDAYGGASMSAERKPARGQGAVAGVEGMPGRHASCQEAHARSPPQQRRASARAARAPSRHLARRACRCSSSATSTSSGSASSRPASSSPSRSTWAGTAGSRGDGARRRPALAARRVAYAAPVALVAAGASSSCGPCCPRVAPVPRGRRCACFARARRSRSPPGTLGLGAGATRATASGSRELLRGRGGIARRGALLRDVDGPSATSAPTSSRSSCSLAGILLVTGASVAGVLTRHRIDAWPTRPRAIRRTATRDPGRRVDADRSAH